MSEHQASRTLLKSPPELWTECSDAQSLARHLEEHYGEIRITKLEPERTVAWEGERASGTVTLEPSGWGTKVTLTATSDAVEPVVAVAPDPAPAPDPPLVQEPEPEPQPVRVGFVARMRLFFRPEPIAPPPPAVYPTTEPPESTTEPPESPTSPPSPPDQGTEALTAALDSLGKAHHRPFSRA